METLLYGNIFWHVLLKSSCRKCFLCPVIPWKVGLKLDWILIQAKSWMVAKVHLKYFPFSRLAQNHCWWSKKSGALKLTLVRFSNWLENSVTSLLGWPSPKIRQRKGRNMINIQDYFDTDAMPLVLCIIQAFTKSQFKI